MSMGLNWRDIDVEKPEDGQACLTIMKHGIIEWCYSTKDNDFGGYYWTDITWWASKWVPIEEV